MPTRIALLGLGRIARQSHLPALRRSPEFQLVAAVDPVSTAGMDVPVFADCRQLLQTFAGKLDAVAICTPPQIHAELATLCVAAGLHVLLEKPPTTSLGEAQALLGLTGTNVIYFTWHSRMNTGVELAKTFLQDASTWRFDAVWREDPQVWHAGQQWIWQEGGLGAFDAGINALSILTALSQSHWQVERAELGYQERAQTPVAAVIWLSNQEGNSGRLLLDWRAELPQRWDIRIVSRKGNLELGEQGSIVKGALQHQGDKQKEYDLTYERFYHLIRERRSEVDYEPLRIVADCFLIGKRVPVAQLNF